MADLEYHRDKAQFHLEGLLGTAHCISLQTL